MRGRCKGGNPSLMTGQSTTVDRRAAAFVLARRQAQALAAYPGAMPETEDNAYAIQQAARQLWPFPVAGWKVGLIQPPFDLALGRSRLFGPIFANAVIASGNAPAVFGCIPGGFAAVEAEYVLRVGRDIGPQTGWLADAAAATVDRVFAGIEFAGSPFFGINDHGPLVTISDFGNNAGLLLGPSLPGGLAELETAQCSVWIDGRELGRGGASSIPEGPLGSLIELLEHCGRRGEMLPAGTLVSTGAATGVHPVTAGQRAMADFGQLGQLHVDLVEASPC